MPMSCWIGRHSRTPDETRRVEETFEVRASRQLPRRLRRTSRRHRGFEPTRLDCIRLRVLSPWAQGRKDSTSQSVQTSSIGLWRLEKDPCLGVQAGSRSIVRDSDISTDVDELLEGPMTQWNPYRLW